MKPLGSPVPTGADAGLGAASGSAMPGRWIAALVVMAMLLVGLAGTAGYTGIASGLIDSGDRQSAAPPASSAPLTASRKPEAARAEPAVAPVRPPSAGTRAATGSASPPAELRWPIWEFQLRQPIPPRDPPLTPPPWRLVGSTTSGTVKQVIILRQGKTAPEFYVKGDSLPGGYVVGEITDEDVTLIQGKRALLLSFIGIR